MWVSNSIGRCPGSSAAPCRLRRCWRKAPAHRKKGQGIIVYLRDERRHRTALAYGIGDCSSTRKPVRRRSASSKSSTPFSMPSPSLAPADSRDVRRLPVLGRHKTLVTAASATCHRCRGSRRMPPVSSKCAHRPSSLTSIRQPGSALSMDSANHACAPSALSISLVATTLPCGSITLNATMGCDYPSRSVFKRFLSMFSMHVGLDRRACQGRPGDVVQM